MDLTPVLMPRLLDRLLPNLDMGQDAVFPAYDGLSLLNVPASLSSWLGGPALPHMPLAIPELQPLAEDIQQVVVALVDAVSFNRFLAWLEGPALSLKPFVDAGLLAPLTSVVPSTTTSALTTLWTGASPAEHGILGYELFLREFGLVVNMITLAPAILEGQRGFLKRGGVAADALLPVPTLGTRLTAAGVETHVFIPNAIRASGLSRMHYAGASVHGFGSPADLWHSVRGLVEDEPAHRRLVWTYYAAVDALSHVYGPDSDIVAVEFAYYVRALTELFLGPLNHDARRGVLFVLLADHGQIATPVNPYFQLTNHPQLTRRLHLTPTGEARQAYLHVRPGQVEAVAEYFDRAWPGAFSLLPSELALDVGLFGPGHPYEASAGRLGERIALARGNAYLWWSPKPDVLLGRHGGLTSDEMLVPILAVRLA
jgi:hypothetical protein